MYKITSMTSDGRHGGTWRVLPGDTYETRRGDNPNLFFATLAAARKAVRNLNH